MKPQSAVANMLRETQIATEAAYAPAPQDMQLGYTLGETFGAAAEAGAQQLEGDVKRFGAIYNLIKGDEEQAQKRLNQAEVLSQTSGKILGDLGEFSAFVEEPTVEGFFEQVIKGIGQFTPMAVSSIASGFAGGAVATIGKGVLSSASKKVTNDMMASIVKKHALHKAGKGAALNVNEKAILDAAYETAKKSGQYVNYLNVARAGQAANLGRPASVQAIANFPAANVGFWAGAFGQEYVVGSSQALAEYDEAGYKLTKEEAKAALGLGIPQAVLGTLGEKLFVGALFKRAAKDFVKTGDKKFGNYMKEMARGLGGGLLQGGTQEGLTELGQEELLIRQRMAIDPEYSSQDANLRRAESAFVGFWAGGARSAPTSAVANVIGLARSNVEGASDIVEAIKSGKVTAASKLPQESLRDLTAQTRDMLTPGKPKKGVWVPFQGSETAADKAGYFMAILNNLQKQGVIDDKTAAKLDFVVDPDGSGFFIYDRSNSESQALANDFQANGFSEGQLRKNLGYTYEQDASQTDAVVVRDKDGNEIHAESIPNEEAFKPKEEQSVLAKLEQEYAKQIAEEGYTVKQETKEEVVNTRNKKIEAEVRGFEGEENIDPETGEIVDRVDPVLDEFGPGVTIQDAPDDGQTIVTERLKSAERPGRERQAAQRRRREQKAAMSFSQVASSTIIAAIKDPKEQAAARRARINLEEDFYDIIGPEERTTWVSKTIEEFGMATTGRINSVPNEALQAFIKESKDNPTEVYSLELNENNEWGIVKQRTPESETISVQAELSNIVQKGIGSTFALERNLGESNKGFGRRIAERRKFALAERWSVKKPGEDTKYQAVDISFLIDFAMQVNQERRGLTTEYTLEAGYVADAFDTALDLLAEQGYKIHFAGKPLNQSDGWVNTPLYRHGKKNVSYSQAISNRGEKLEPSRLSKRQAEALNKAGMDVKEGDPVPTSLELRELLETVPQQVVSGGTGWAVQMALDMGKPVYVFDGGKWYEWTTLSKQQDMFAEDLPSGKKGFVELKKAPDLTKDHAIIGTRDAEPKFTSPTTINVWSTDKNTFESLSNFAKRPFKYVDGKQYYSVEHAYQSWKTGQFNETVYNDSRWKQGKVFKKGEPKKDNDWNIKLMEKLMRASFAANPEAMALLKKTGNAKLTHNNPSGKKDFWTNQFPKLLEKIRGVPSKEIFVNEAFNKRIRNQIAALYRGVDSVGTGPTVVVSKNVKADEAAGKGINVLRKEGEQHYGNPFSHLETQTRDTRKTKNLQDSVDQYKAWLEGTAHTDFKQERRNWVLQQIDSGALDNATLLYYSKQSPNHAEALSAFVAERRGLDSGYTNHSGGAIGVDMIGKELGEKKGVKQNHYYVEGKGKPKGANVAISQQEANRANPAIEKANETLNRDISKASENVKALYQRNFWQADNAEAIYAFASLMDNPVYSTISRLLDQGLADRMEIDVEKTATEERLDQEGYLYAGLKIDPDTQQVYMENDNFREGGKASEAITKTNLRMRDERREKRGLGSPTVFGPSQKEATTPKEKTFVGNDIEAVFKGIIPVLGGITRQFFGRRNLTVLSIQQVLKEGGIRLNAGEGYIEAGGKFKFDGKEHKASDILKMLATDMQAGNKNGKWIKFADTEVILINLPKNATPIQLQKALLALGHEIGHSIYNQAIENAVVNKNMRQRLQKAFEADKKRVGTVAYEGKYGFEEWFSDQMGTWLLKEMQAGPKGTTKATNAVDSFFKRLAKKLIGVFKQLDQLLQKRFTLNMDFDAYVSELSEAIRDSKNPISIEQEIEIRDMVDDVASGVHDAYMPKPLRVRIKNKAVQTLKTMGELLPTDRRHWGVEYLFLPAHNVLKRVLTRAGLDPAFADMIYNPSQSKAATGTLNGRISLMYMRLNELGKLAPQKKNGEPDIDAWEATLKEAEDDTLAYGQLSPEAKKVRRFLEDFYKDNIEGKDPLIKFRENFYPRIINMEALLDNENGERAALASVIVKHNKMPLEAAEAYVEKMLQENERNPDDPQDTVSEVSLGMAKERSDVFTKIPNKDLRDIGVLQDPYVALVTYVQDMTKRIDYKERVTAQVTQADIDNAKKLAKETRQKNLNLKANEKLDNPLGFLLKSDVKVGQEFNGWQASEIHINRIADPRERAKARNAVRSMLGVVGGIKSKPLRQLNNFILAFNVVTMLTFAALASLPDLGGTVLRSKDFGAIKTFGQQMRKYFNNREQARAFARDVGVVSFDSLNTMYLNAAELGFMGDWSKFATEKFFIATGLEAYTKFTRVFAAGMGEQFLVTKAADNSDIATRHLEELQITREDIKKWVKNGRSFETAEGEKVRAAIARFVDESIMRPNSAERPGWASSPHFAVVWQLKSFFYAYGKNIIGGTLREANNRYSEDGKLTSAAIPLVLGATALLPLTMLGLEIRELIKYFGRGMDPAVFRSDNMTWPQYTGEIIDRSGALGAFGLIIPMLDAGKYGGQWWVPPLGPTAERVEKLMNGKVRGKDFLPFYDLGAGELLGL